ncbi:acyltransferase [Gammaproteobacteria bacterium]|nr:acyltransferase [Gammaproteobacteria bacterium]
MSDFSRTRHIGLDLARSIAIILVLLSHSRFLTDFPEDYLFLTVGAKFGVELFFVLSGFLIGTVLLKQFQAGLSSRLLSRFWFRRWFRTIPAYFFLLFFIWVFFDELDFFYFFFLQDLVRGNWDLVPVSWSLVIEEWFYLIFPLLIVFCSVFNKKDAFLISAVALLLLSFIYPLHEYSACSYDPRQLTCFENELRKSTFRFGSLGFGAILAYFSFKHDLKKISRKYSQVLIPSLGLSSMLLATFCYQVVSGETDRWFPTSVTFAVFYPFMGFVAVLWVIFLYSVEFKFPKFAQDAIRYISITSYSNYLWHMILFNYLNSLSEQFFSSYLVAIFFIASFLAAGFSYLMIERPFLGLRDKLVP